MYFKQFFDEKLAQYAYMIGCQANGQAIIIDPMRDVDQYFKLAEKEGLELIAAADTHIHADYVSGLQELAEKGIHIYASDEGDADWKYNWLTSSDTYNYTLLHNGDTIKIGNIVLEAVHTPGHTPEHISYSVTDGAATDKAMGLLSGDFVFVGDVGRPDLLETAAGQAGAMEPSARTLYQSLEYFKNLPDYMKVWPAHGAGSACGKALGAVPDSTVGYEKNFSAAFKMADEESRFVDYILDGQPEPPLYFARMKKVNRDGINVLGDLPAPKAFTPEELLELDDVVFLDGRKMDDFMKAHLKHSILATYNKQYNTIAGSYITEDEKIVLIIDTANVEQAVRDLVRVGLDKIVGFVDADAFTNWIQQSDSDKIQTIKTIDFSEINSVDGHKVLDVRKATEFAEGHVNGAINIAHTRLLNQLDSLDKNDSYLVHCQAGGRASAAVSLLESKGYDVIFVDGEYKNAPEAMTTS